MKLQCAVCNEAVGLYERQWKPFELEVSQLKLELAHFLHREGKGQFGLADCEIKSSWLRHTPSRQRHSPFLAALHADDMDRLVEDTNIQLNRFIAMEHAALLRRGNPNMFFPHIVEYPFFTRSELSNGVQLADLLAYNVYRAFRDEDPNYPYFRSILPHFYRRRDTAALSGIKIWPETSPLVDLAERV